MSDQVDGALMTIVWFNRHLPIRVDQIYEVEIANLQGHLQEILSPEFLRTICWYMTSFMTS